MTYFVCLILIAAAIPTAVWLKREGEREWAWHRARTATGRFAIGAIQTEAALAKASQAVIDARIAVRQLREALDQARPWATTIGPVHPDDKEISE